MRTVLVGLLVVVTATACKKKESSDSAANKPADTTAPAADKPAAAPAVPAAPAPELCSFVTKEQVEAALGEKVKGEPEKMAAQGSFLGSCTWETENNRAVLSARPANEFAATAKEGTDVAGVGEAAKMTSSGLMVKVPGKSYFFQVMTMTGTNMDNAKAADIAKAAVAGAK